MMSKSDLFRHVREDIDASIDSGWALYYEADKDCRDGRCGFPKLWFGKCLAMYREDYTRRTMRLRGIYIDDLNNIVAHPK